MTSPATPWGEALALFPHPPFVLSILSGQNSSQEPVSFGKDKHLLLTR